MPEDPWITYITITCQNLALRRLWQEIEDQLRMIIVRCGHDTLRQTKKLKDVAKALNDIRLTTVDMTKSPHQRFK